MFEKILPKKASRLLGTLAHSGVTGPFYLGGGTAVALHLGHRRSYDLDFFSEKEVASQELIQCLEKVGEFSVEREDRLSISGILDGIKVEFFNYPYPLLKSTRRFQDVSVADLLDLACMKLSAISSRGTRRDFIDLYMICRKRRSLQTILRAFAKKYRSVHYNRIHLLKSLVYFEDAQSEPMPRLLRPLDWERLKRFFQTEVETL